LKPAITRFDRWRLTVVAVFRQLGRLQNHVAATEERVKSCDKQFDMGLASAIFAKDSLVCVP